MNFDDLILARTYTDAGIDPATLERWFIPVTESQIINDTTKKPSELDEVSKLKSEIRKLNRALRDMADDIIKNYDYPITRDDFVERYIKEADFEKA